ncbi:myb/SANT-like DNA-binding domain-containing protein 3 isoform X1 [Photinus pyralis]|uniref:myb/SANT-like DNA-binding domain-containing protein 3 isoform X1 n=1 Tax=Photinus pyralis TaxID=7054 RepID=UPI0012677ECE|nr:myb/SANT-like DNA-binding domain-containing protein 3 isoform X1 [Photinus pyralis]XP_031338996.1 myb/SANT-like DNA-binding domain-containing protein 3 isoform X1 [Photinus pyralis]XP_031338999.1 myb/SANT-like DNA-binding domain-containing protein 3 isoform X1 [Photinus pyralis]XP_031339744.1 myb/SANT-like DNA-binding domain-containing protein 3 isoform X1 [Photinus pyralis]XP_031357357.1 myb/SANT-like DNA-binding domain-containing protein 3 isoform X1 [Photinus pyralis]
MEKKIRGKNFTEVEREHLLQIIESKKHILESRVTSAQILLQKQQAWKCVTEDFNSECISKRTTKQLKHFYDNIKRNARKAEASSNKERYREQLKKAFDGEMSQDDIEKLPEEALYAAKCEKEGRKKTGGGSCESTTNDSMSLVLSIMGDTVKPLPNPFDSASSYHDDEAILLLEPSPPAIIPEVVDQSIPSCSFSSIADRQPAPKGGIIAAKRRPKTKMSIQQIKKNYYLQKLKNARLEYSTLLMEKNFKKRIFMNQLSK